MPYRNAIPQPNDSFDQSQRSLLENFQQIADIFNVDHSGFGGGAVEGMHSKTSFNQVNALPTFNIGEIGLSAVTPVGPLAQTGQTELVLTKSDGTNVLLTGSGQAQTGWAFLPSGILLKWGQASVTGRGNITFPVANNIPVFNSVLNAQVCIQDAFDLIDVNRFVIVSTYNTTTLTVNVTIRTIAPSSFVTANVNYFVIGT